MMMRVRLLDGVVGESHFGFGGGLRERGGERGERVGGGIESGYRVLKEGCRGERV